ncbi:MAG TPA: TolC family protein, partial [Thermoanaerobaculia bacterium]|nr:TolC family protein [Thermoanaerobaculia bacterium]
ERQLLREAGEAFLRAVAAEDRRALLARSRQAAEGLLAATERRYEAGEATAIELNRSRTAAAAARAEEKAAEADRATALSRLQSLLGLPPAEEVSVSGSLAPRPLPDVEALLRTLDQRPDLAALTAEVREAEAEVLLGQALAGPAWGLRGGYQREEGADAVTAGVAVSLPWHDRGQETLALGQARAESLRGALALARQGAEAEVRRAAEALARQTEAVLELERAALPALDDNESLAEKSFDAGEIDLGELLLLRREILETRLLYADRLLDAALARLELETAAGALR